MQVCSNLDEFYDVVFRVDNCDIMAYSHVLKARSSYFEAMLSTHNRFKEVSQMPCIFGDGREYQLVQINNVQKNTMKCILQYIYSDHFLFMGQNIDFFVQLMICADYFMLPRLVQICSKYIKDFVTHQNVLCVVLLAQAHNAGDLLRFCLNYICLNEESILSSREWSLFKKLTDQNLFDEILNEIASFRDGYHVQHQIQLYIKENSRVAKTRIEPIISQQ